jgi:hypothetical protein
MPQTEPLLKGRFSLYETADGGYHLAYLADGETEPKHLEVPAMAVRMAKLAAEGKLSPLKALAGMRHHEPA